MYTFHYSLPQSAFDRDQIAGNTRRSSVIRYKPDRDHLYCWSQPSGVETMQFLANKSPYLRNGARYRTGDSKRRFYFHRSVIIVATVNITDR